MGPTPPDSTRFLSCSPVQLLLLLLLLMGPSLPRRPYIVYQTSSDLGYRRIINKWVLKHLTTTWPNYLSNWVNRLLSILSTVLPSSNSRILFVDFTFCKLYSEYQLTILKTILKTVLFWVSGPTILEIPDYSRNSRNSRLFSNSVHSVDPVYCLLVVPSATFRQETQTMKN